MDGFGDGFEPRLSCEMNLQPLEHPLYMVAKVLFLIVYCGQKIPNHAVTFDQLVLFI